MQQVIESIIYFDVAKYINQYKNHPNLNKYFHCIFTVHMYKYKYTFRTSIRWILVLYVYYHRTRKILKYFENFSQKHVDGLKLSLENFCFISGVVIPAQEVKKEKGEHTFNWNEDTIERLRVCTIQSDFQMYAIFCIERTFYLSKFGTTTFEWGFHYKKKL